jgi:hypothetical protein
MSDSHKEYLFELTCDHFYVICTSCGHWWCPGNDPIEHWPTVCESCHRDSIGGPYLDPETAIDAFEDTSGPDTRWED